jgi:hypothetical protein
MSKSSLKFLAVVLSVLIAVVLFAGFDNLPRDLRKQIGAERAQLRSAQTEVGAARDAVGRQVQSESALFSGIPSSRQYPDRFEKAATLLASATRGMDELSSLEKQNRRQDRQRVEALLAEERTARANAAAEASGVRKDADHWVDLKQHLPNALSEMDRDYRTVHDFDLASVTATAHKAAIDWPEKKADLDARLAAESDLAAQGERAWQSTADLRRQAANGNYAGLDFGALFGAADQLKTAAAGLPAKAAEVKALSAQLYYSWDKLLVDMERRGSGSQEYRQKLRTVRTQLADASTKNGATTSEDNWVQVSPGTYSAMRNDLGMAVEHKPAGKFDYEADHVAQPAGFAYMAPLSQGRNQYGEWQHSGGRDFWVFYGQYALMRDLLFNHNYRPIDRGEWDGYRGSQTRGQTYYGNDGASGQRYGTQGSTTQQTYSGSSYAKGGGFKDSKFASKPGSFRDSPYATPSSRQPGGSAPRSFGGNSRPSSPAPSFRPTPAPRSFHMPSGAGRRFGRR